MNFSLLKAFYDRLSPRTKMIGAAILAFLVGTLFGGHGTSEGTGRYQAYIGGGVVATLDTHTGQLYILDGDGKTYHRGPKVSFF